MTDSILPRAGCLVLPLSSERSGEDLASGRKPPDCGDCSKEESLNTDDAGNFLGPLLLGHQFDTVGRKKMNVGTYGLSGLLLIAVAALFGMGPLTARTQTFCWMVIFVASAAASSAYLTASEIFLLETGAMAIALFYALGTLIGGVSAPIFFGYLIGSGSEWAVAAGYVGAAVLMIAAAVCEAFLGVEAAGKSLEDVAQLLSSTA